MARAVAFTSQDEHLAWLKTWRDHTATMLADYDPGLTRAFNTLGADVTDEHKASLRRTLQEIDVMIERIEPSAFSLQASSPD